MRQSDRAELRIIYYLKNKINQPIFRYKISENLENWADITLEVERNESACQQDKEGN